MLNWRAWHLLMGILVAAPMAAWAQIPAFPGAEGFGAISVGGRGGDIYHVNSLADTNTQGTLRHAVSSAPASGRIVVFDISGDIHLNSDLSFNKPKLTIAGQTAPGQGITLSGDSVWLENDDLVVRYMRSRLTSTGGTQDSLSIQNGNRVILDHSSASWSSDEITSMTRNSTDNTIQWSLITEALNVANHSRSSLFRPGADDDGQSSYNLSVHHSLYAHSSDRNPVFATYTDFGPKALNADFRNNVVFDWRNQASHTGSSDAYVNINFEGNYYVTGLTTRADLVADPKIYSADGPRTIMYHNDNKVDATRDDGLHNGIYLASSVGGGFVNAATPFNFPAVTTQSADDAYDSVLNYAGSFWWNRDPVDSRVITDVHEISDPDPAVRAMSGMMITTEADVGGLPALPIESRAASWDSDGDGMPGWWELEHGLDPNTGGAAQYNGDFDGDGYTNIEEYINDVGAFPATQPIVFSGSTNNRYAQITNWDIKWQPSRFDEAQINDGTVVVDAAGQHAGTLKMGTNPGDNATLNITDGWLKIEDAGDGLGTGEVIVGADPTATAALNLSGGLLRTETLSKGAGGSFNFTGGVLSADEVSFDLVNDGGTIAPGTSVGQSHVAGDLEVNSGALQIEIDSASAFDKLLVDDTATIDGNLEVTLNSFLPESTDVFEILTAGSLAGVFANAPELVFAGLGTFDVTYTSTAVQLSNFVLLEGLWGDYNGDDEVDAADYTVWRDNLGLDVSLPNDLTPGTVDEFDFEVWRGNFGETLGEGSGQGLAQVPEPTTISLAALCLWLYLANAGRAGRIRKTWGFFACT